MLTVSEKGLEKTVIISGKTGGRARSTIAECDVGVIPISGYLLELNTPTRIFEYLAWPVWHLALQVFKTTNDDALVFLNLEPRMITRNSLGWHCGEALEITNRGQAVYLDHAWSKEVVERLRTL
jgi:hypothetical protein